jgi:hypothetical protein
VDSLVSLPSLPAELPQSLLKEYRDAANKAEAEHKQKAPGTPFTPPALKGKLSESIALFSCTTALTPVLACGSACSRGRSDGGRVHA